MQQEKLDLNKYWKWILLATSLSILLQALWEKCNKKLIATIKNYLLVSGNMNLLNVPDKIRLENLKKYMNIF